MWTHQAETPVFMPDSPLLNRELDRSYDRAIRQALTLWGGKPLTLLEVGCGASRYLPYFAKYHGLTVYGLDYSETGCVLARKALTDQHTEGEIRQGDMFEPQAGFGPFDIVFSTGLLEHFPDTAGAAAALRAFLKPGGLMLSFIPNMYGLTGFMQKHMDRAVYDTHVLLDAPALAAAHTAAGLDVLATDYIMTVNFAVVRSLFDDMWFGRILSYARSGLNRIVWTLERIMGRSWPNRLTSPYIVCVARAKE